jgi:hypothetical protein
VIAWAGYTNGKIDMIRVDTGWGGFGTGDRATMAAIFKTKAEAEARYMDVRKVQLIDSFVPATT